MTSNLNDHVLVSTDTRRNLVIVDYRHVPEFDPAIVQDAVDKRVALGSGDQRVLVYAGSGFYHKIDKFTFQYSMEADAITRAIAFVAESPMDYQKIREFASEMMNIRTFKVFRDDSTAATWLASQ